MKYVLTAALVVSFFLSPAGGFLSSAHAESGTVQKAIEGVKESIGNLVGAKDEKTSDELGLRISTFRKVLELSVAETKDFKVSLLSIDTKDPDLLRWKNAMLETLKAAAEQFDKELDWLSDNEKTLTLDGIKRAAEDFKKWRDENYLGSVDQIQEFLLLDQEGVAIKTAEKRFQKIADEVKKILKTKGSLKQTKDLNALLESAEKLITGSHELNDQGQKLFWGDHVFPLIPVPTSTATSTPSATSTPTSTPPVATTTRAITLLPSGISTSTVTTSTLPAEPTPPAPPTVKELVIASLTKIRDAYQTFIDMSGLVRELFK